MAAILVVEDDRNTLNGLVEILTEEGYEVTGVENAEKALPLLEKQSFDVLLTDLRLPGIDGNELFDKSRTIAPELKTIVITAFSSVKEAVELMKRGVYEYLTKPINLDELFVVIKKALAEKVMYLENIELRDQVESAYHYENMVGKSEAIKRVFTLIAKVAKSQSTVLIRGESGVGKELVARAIHYNSPRHERSLVEISCASLPETLLESELFGYERGAFTGAETRKKGRLELADGGSIFLDEIGDISENVQTKLLRVLQERVISRLGGNDAIKVDVRIIAATNRNLEKALQEHRFREDLYYRLNVIPIFVPPLRERKEDIPILVAHFIQRFGLENRRPNLTFSQEALDLCMEYHWPGNVRELENAVENAVVLSDGDVIYPKHLPFYIFAKASQTDLAYTITSEVNFRKQMENAERFILINAINRANGNKTKAARALGISLRTMRYKIKKYKLK